MNIGKPKEKPRIEPAPIEVPAWLPPLKMPEKVEVKV